MSRILNKVFGRHIMRETNRYLKELATAPERAFEERATTMITNLGQSSGQKISLGQTQWGASVNIAMSEILRGYGLVTGGTGSGKTMFALNLIRAFIDASPGKFGFGVIDPKGDLFCGAVSLLADRLRTVAKSDPGAAKELRRRIVIYDFAARDPLSSYNILARWPGVDPDFFASNRSDLLLDLLSGGDRLSLGGIGVLQKLLLLLSESGMPITYLEDVLTDQDVLNRLLAKSQNALLRSYFERQYESVPQATIAAIRRRIEALFSSEGVRMALSGTSAPDFRRLQDENKIVLVNCFGESISRGTRRVLQGLVLSDIRQGIFSRREKDQPYLWVADEAQNFFLTESLRDNMADLLTMSRSFGSHFMFLTQNMSTAMQDARMLKILYTNLRWSFSMRGEPGDCAFLKAVLPITGQKVKPAGNPFEGRSVYSQTEERSLVLDQIAGLSDRIGYLWLRNHSAEAFQMKTADLAVPEAGFEKAAQALRNDPTIGSRLSRKAYEGQIAERDRTWITEPETDLSNMADKLTAAYRNGRKHREQ